MAARRVIYHPGQYAIDSFLTLRDVMTSNLLRSMRKAYKQLSKWTIEFCLFPSKAIASCIGLGYLPVWGNHWAAFLATTVTFLLLYVEAFYTTSLATMSVTLLKVTILGYIINLGASHILLKKEKDVEEQLVMGIFFGQILIFGISGPAILYASAYFVALFKRACSIFLHCPTWFYLTMIFIPVFAVPFTIFRFIEIMKPWPASFWDKRYKNCFSKAGESIVCAIYASLLTYFLAFVLSDLTLLQAIEFFHALKNEILSTIMGSPREPNVSQGDMNPFEFIQNL